MACIPAPGSAPTALSSQQRAFVKQGQHNIRYHSFKIVTPLRPAPELCPAHWRLSPKKNLKARLKTFARKAILKEISPTHAIPSRPTMRMKDSDDYLTARAANPRTGVISPSVAGSPKTPETPAEALKVWAQQQQDHTGLRPCLARTGRRLNGRSIASLRSGLAIEQDEKRLIPAVQIISADISPQKQDEAARFPRAPSSQLHDDQFIVNMPSAQEPQPYAFPGHTAAQIEAYEHYKRKARRTSGEGYDRRLSPGARNVSDGSDTGQFKAFDTNAALRSRPSLVQGQALKAHFRPTAHTAHDIIAVAKLRNGQETIKPGACSGAEKLGEVSFKVYRSPRTPRRKPLADSSDFLLTKHMPGSFCDITPEPLLEPYTEFRQEHDGHIAASRESSLPSCTLQHLNQLPPVQLVPPALASVHAIRSRSGGSRKCSLGCRRAADTDMCIDLRTTSLQLGEKRRVSLFDCDHRDVSALSETHHASPTSQMLEIASTAASFLCSLCGELSASNASLLDKLWPPSLSVWERLILVGRVLFLLGRCTVVLMAAALLWKVVTACLHITEFIFRPATASLRLLRWLATSA